MTDSEPLIRVMALHALASYERLFYLEEVEEIRLADEALYAGRRLHEELAADEGDLVSLTLEVAALGCVSEVGEAPPTARGCGMALGPSGDAERR
jgi:CRISPR-associated protein Cas1